jgi:hypothetical protein
VRGLIAGGLAAAALGVAAPGVAMAAGVERAETLRAGAAAVEVALPPGTPLAGYGGFPRRAWMPDLLGRHPEAFWFRPSLGVHDPITARALALEGDGVRLVWLALDLVGVDPGLVGQTRDRLSPPGGPAPVVVVSASHTHSGPGAYADSALFALVALDRLSPRVRERVIAAMEQAGREALARLRPARLGVATTLVPDLAVSRVGKPLDPELGLLKVMGQDGRPVAALWNYAIHGTALARKNRLLSGDLMGAAAAQIERRLGAPALFVNGAVGDVSPRHHGWAGVRTGGDALAAAVLRAWDDTPLDDDGRLAVAAETVALPEPRLALRNCAGRWLPRALTIGLSAALPSRVDLVGVRTGRASWVAVPGELETRLGVEIKAGRSAEVPHVFVAGVSNDYLGYFLGPEAYGRPSYIACASLYGPRGGEAIRDGARRLVDRLRATAPARPRRGV